MAPSGSCSPRRTTRRRAWHDTPSGGRPIDVGRATQDRDDALDTGVVGLEQLVRLAGAGETVDRHGVVLSLTSVRVLQDKTVEIQPRWGEPVTITFTKRASVLHRPSG